MREDRFKQIAGTLFRCLALGGVVVALAGPLEGSYSHHTDVIFALDISRSVDRRTGAAALDFVNHAFAGKDPDTRMGLVVFGGDAAAEVLLSRRRLSSKKFPWMCAATEPISSKHSRWRLAASTPMETVGWC